MTFSVLGVEAVPWSVPDIGTTTTKSGRRVRFARRRKRSNVGAGQYSLDDWEAAVRSSAVAAMRGAGYTGPVTCQIHVKYSFFAKTPTGKKHGQIWPVELAWDEKKRAWSKKSRGGKTDPDLTNVVKSTEDGFQGAAAENDCVVASMEAGRFFGPVPGVRISVYELEENDHPGEGGEVTE